MKVKKERKFLRLGNASGKNCTGTCGTKRMFLGEERKTAKGRKFLQRVSRLVLKNAETVSFLLDCFLSLYK